MIFTELIISLSIRLHDALLRRSQSQVAQVHGIRTHIGNQSGFIQTLREHHRLRDRVTQLAGGLLLQGRSGKRRRRRFPYRLLRNLIDRERRLITCLQKSPCLLLVFQAAVQLRFQQGRAIGQDKGRHHPVSGLRHEIVDLALAFHDQTNGDRLHTSRRQRRLDPTPQDRRKLETHDTIQHTASLLRVH